MCPNENKSVLCCAGKICVQYMKKTCAIQGQICAPEQTRPSKRNLSHHARRKCTRTTEEMRINKIILAMMITIVPMGVIKHLSLQFVVRDLFMCSFRFLSPMNLSLQELPLKKVKPKKVELAVWGSICEMQWEGSPDMSSSTTGSTIYRTLPRWCLSTMSEPGSACACAWACGVRGTCLLCPIRGVVRLSGTFWLVLSSFFRWQVPSVNLPKLGLDCPPDSTRLHQTAHPDLWPDRKYQPCSYHGMY